MGHRVFLYGAGVALFLLYAALVITKPISQDEGVFLAAGKYLNQGFLPYQDFFDHKPPGIHFLLAGLFAFFGTSVWVTKVVLIASVLASTWLVQRMAQRGKAGSGWVAAVIFLFLMTQFEGYFLIAEPFMLLPLLLSLWLVLTKREGWWMFMAGLSLGLAVLFKQTAVLSAIPVLILAVLVNRHRVVTFAAGALLPLAVVGSFLLASGVLDEAWEQVVVLTATSYPAEPIGVVLHGLQPSFVWTLPIWVLLMLGLRTKFLNRKSIWALILLLLPFMFFRHYPHYWVQILPFVAIVAAAAAAEFRRRTVVGAALVLFCLVIAGGKVYQDAGKNWETLQAQMKIAGDIQTDSRRRGSDVNTMLLAENKFTAFYFLLPQPPLNRFLYQTEITDAVGVQPQTMNDLRMHQNVLILWPEPSRAYAGVLEEYIKTESWESTLYDELDLQVYMKHQSPNTKFQTNFKFQ